MLGRKWTHRTKVLSIGSTSSQRSFIRRATRANDWLSLLPTARVFEIPQQIFRSCHCQLIVEVSAMQLDYSVEEPLNREPPVRDLVSR